MHNFTQVNNSGLHIKIGACVALIIENLFTSENSLDARQRIHTITTYAPRNFKLYIHWHISVRVSKLQLCYMNYTCVILECWSYQDESFNGIVHVTLKIGKVLANNCCSGLHKSGDISWRSRRGNLTKGMLRCMSELFIEMSTFFQQQGVFLALNSLFFQYYAKHSMVSTHL